MEETQNGMEEKMWVDPQANSLSLVPSSPSLEAVKEE